MEYALEVVDSSDTVTVFSVLILVLMEYALEGAHRVRN